MLSEKRSSLGHTSPDRPKRGRISLPVEISLNPVMTSTQNETITPTIKPPTLKTPPTTITRKTTTTTTSKSPPQTRTPARQRVAEVMIEHSDKKNASIRMEKSQRPIEAYIMDEKERGKRDTRLLYDMFAETARDSGYEFDLDKQYDKTMDYLLNSFFW